MTVADARTVQLAIDRLRNARNEASPAKWIGSQYMLLSSEGGSVAEFTHNSDVRKTLYALAAFDMVLELLEDQYSLSAAEELPSGDEPNHGEILVALAEKILEVQW